MADNSKFNCDYLSGSETISEEQFLLNYNNLASSAVQHYKEIMEELNQDMGRWWKSGTGKT